KIGFAPARLDNNDRAAGLLAGGPDRPVPILVAGALGLAGGLLGVLDRVVDNAKMKSLAGRGAAHTGRPEPPALPCQPLLDRAAGLVELPTAAQIELTSCATEGVGQVGAVAGQADEAIRVAVEVVGREEPRDELALAVARRLEDHHAGECAVGDLL